ncbi:MAG: hypothetical protein ABIG68_10740 [Acidobacteriota bacterium]
MDWQSELADQYQRTANVNRADLLEMSGTSVSSSWAPPSVGYGGLLTLLAVGALWLVYRDEKKQRRGMA